MMPEPMGVSVQVVTEKTNEKGKDRRTLEALG